MRRLAAKVSYIVDPGNPYPNQFTGHIRVTLKNGEVHEHRQAYFKGGADHPLSDEDIRAKFIANCVYGGLTPAAAAKMANLLAHVIDGGRVDLSALPA